MAAVDDHIDVEKLLLPNDSGTRQMMNTALVFFKSVYKFRALIQDTYEKTPAAADDYIGSDQTAPLIEPSSHSILATKEDVTSAADACTTEGVTLFMSEKLIKKPAVAEASDSSVVSPEHQITIGDINQRDVDELKTIVCQKNMQALVDHTDIKKQLLAVNNGSPSQDSCEDIPFKSVNEDQNAPLIETSDSKKLIRRLMNVLHSIRAFKAHKPEGAEASDSSAVIPEHRITINADTVKQLKTIVRQKNLQALDEFGGLPGAEKALCTNLVDGISEEDALIIIQQTFHLSLTPTHRFLDLVWDEIKRKPVLLLLLSLGLILSTVFDIIQEGLKYVYYNGVVVLVAIILVVLVPSISNYRQEKRAERKLQLAERKEGRVHVIRGGKTKKVYESELVRGDLVLLYKDVEVPGDGLIVGNEQLELDYGHIINEQNPFLSYGERVINGDALMVVTSPKRETEWTERMKEAGGDPNTRLKLEKVLRKCSTCIQYIVTVMGILTLLVVFVRNEVLKLDNDSTAYRPGSMAEATETRSFANMFKEIIKEATYTTKALKLLSVSLLCLTDGMTFVVSIAINYLNDETLCEKATEQDPFAVANMAHVTRICTDTFIAEDGTEVEELIIGGESINVFDGAHHHVFEALCDGIGTLMQKQFRQVKDKFRFESSKRWKTIEKKGAKSFEEPCGVLMKGLDENEEMVWHFNGPLKKILKKCKYYYDKEGQKALLDDGMRQKFVQANDQHKHEVTTIAFAYKPICTETQGVDDLILIALLVLKNKPNEDTNAIVKALRERHIETVLVSSEKIPVVKAIALKCEVVTNGDSESSVITGKVFRSYTHSKRLELVCKIRILGEALYSDKLLLVETMREKGEVVAYLGQRTDESPALVRADIGIAIGTWSSREAVENCDIMIRDESSVNLIIGMVDSGKRIYRNIHSFLQLIWMATIISTFISFIETATLGDASLTAFLLTWLCFAATFLGGLALLTKRSADEPVCVPISCTENSVITPEMKINILFQVLNLAIWWLIIQFKGSAVVNGNHDLKSGVSNIFFSCLFFNLFNAREIQKKNFFRGVHRHKEFWVAAAVFIILHVIIVTAPCILGWCTSLNWKLWAGYIIVGVVSWFFDFLGKCVKPCLYCQDS